jgi:hypothetical protein
MNISKKNNLGSYGENTTKLLRKQKKYFMKAYFSNVYHLMREKDDIISTVHLIAEVVKSILIHKIIFSNARNVIGRNYNHIFFGNFIKSEIT